jgi:hypothetical protein
VSIKKPLSVPAFFIEAAAGNAAERYKKPFWVTESPDFVAHRIVAGKI